ncbi:MAG: acyl carrier protein [Tissierella sp.]|uniref:acyl carrier protein n=1 Tax=Tissierella sp. TaxID=41274 RepID=UPI003F99A02F
MTIEKVKAVVAEQLDAEVEGMEMETSLMEDLDADSLDAVEIIMELEDEFDIEIADEEAEGFKTIGDIVKYIDGKIS